MYYSITNVVICEKSLISIFKLFDVNKCSNSSNTSAQKIFNRKNIWIRPIVTPVKMSLMR